MTTRRISKLYKPAELEAAIAVLCNNHYHNFTINDAHGIITALHQAGYRIIKVGDNE